MVARDPKLREYINSITPEFNSFANSNNALVAVVEVACNDIKLVREDTELKNKAITYLIIMIGIVIFTTQLIIMVK